MSEEFPFAFFPFSSLSSLTSLLLISLILLSSSCLVVVVFVLKSSFLVLLSLPFAFPRLCFAYVEQSFSYEISQFLNILIN